MAFHLLLVLAGGLIAGAVCKRFGVSLLVGYLAVGTLLGALGLRAEEAAGQGENVQNLAQAGVLLLLFSIGIEFSLEELRRLSRFLFLGGSVQMLLVALSVILGAGIAGWPWRPAALVGFAVALSSTVLVYRALEEWGQASSEHGRRTVAVLLFQDMAVVPLLLVVPMLSGNGPPQALAWAVLAIKSLVFVAGVLAVRTGIGRWAVPLLAGLKSVELLVLFAVVVLGGAALAAWLVGLPPALGALAAGMILGGNRLSGQFDAVILPFRETFAAVFFVSLGSLMRFQVLGQMPLLALGGLAVALLLKTAAGALALRLVGLPWKPAFGMGLGMAQLGELSFVVLLEAVGRGVLSAEIYHLMLFIALGTLIATPFLLQLGLRMAETPATAGTPESGYLGLPLEPTERVIVVGLGPIGSAVASQLEIHGLDVCLIDISPVNLQRFAQQGFRTVAGNATDVETLRRAGVPMCMLAVVTVPDDRVAQDIVTAIRGLNRRAIVLVRCRYQSHVAAVRRAGADSVISEEAEAAGALLRLLSKENLFGPGHP